jgi:hypothetical protein
MMGKGKQSRSAPELIEIALAEIQRRKIAGIYNVNISSVPYGGSGNALGMWNLIINQMLLHDDDPLRKGYSEHETPSEKQWRDSLLAVERELQEKFELQDSKIQPHVVSFDRAAVRKMVEDHMREVLRVRGYHKRAQNVTLIDQMYARFANQVDALIDSMPPEQGKEFDQMCAEEMHLIRVELQQDPVACARRLGVLPGRVNQRQGIGEMAVRTAVRATIWDVIWRLFR